MKTLQLVKKEGKVGDAPVNRKRLDPASSPQAAFGVRLRSAREEHGWTQEELAQRLGYSSTHVSSVETGRKPPTLRFAKSSDVAFGTGDMFERLYRKVRNSGLLEGFPQFVEREAEAVEIRLYEVGVVPGLLQTEEYATVLAESVVRRGAISEEQAEERVTLVAERQAALVRTPSPWVFAVLDESCLRLSVGAPDVMRAQLDRLLDFAELPNTTLQVAPFAMGERRTIRLPLYILTLPDRSLLSYAESAQQGHLERDNAFVVPLLTAYHQLQADALSQAESVALISELRKGIP